MKKFLIVSICLFCLAAGIYYAVFSAGLYLGAGGSADDREKLNMRFIAEGSSFYAATETGKEALHLRGVQMSSFVPGHTLSDYAAEEEDYARWIEAAYNMGANLIFVNGIMDDDFYNAFYEYNCSAREPIYLMQGIMTDDAAANKEGIASENGLMTELIDAGKDAVDVIHGRKNIMSAGIGGSGVYRKDVSPWVAGFLIDQEWSVDVIARTDAESRDSAPYTGERVSASYGATAFENMLAQIADRITDYESEKYSAQRPAGVTVSPECDFLEYEDIYARQLSKYSFIDTEHLKTEDGMEAGLFTVYRLSDFCPDFDSYLSESCRAALGSALENIDKSEIYDGYLELVKSHHSSPILGLYSFSSSRGAVTIGQDPMSETEQGEIMALTSHTLESDGWAGGIIGTWQDIWSTKSWNTAFAQIPARNYMWHDIETSAQCSGLMAFDPGDRFVCVPDGDKSEWTDEDLVFGGDGLKLSARYDAEGLYLLAEGIDKERTWLIPIDVCKDIGALSCDGFSAEFTDNADFVLCLNGESSTRLLVQERYDAVRERYLYDTEGRDPFIHFPDKDSSTFVPVTMVLNNQTLVDELTPETRVLKRLGKYETGIMRHGCAAPGAENYDSLADFCFGNGFAEIRIPWLLLNIGEPSSMKAHDDYYENYGVEMSDIRSVYIGIGEDKAGEEPIDMQPFKLRGWKYIPSYRERFKQSYYIMRGEWK